MVGTNIDQQQPYIIGKYYQVPCVKILRSGIKWRKPGDWIPVMPPFHEDAEFIKFPWRHYHYDLRFVPERIFRELSSAIVQIEYPISIRSNGIQYENRSEGPFVDVKPQMKWRKCKREMPPWPYRAGPASWTVALESAYEDARLVRGKCPHRGIDLAGCPVVDGIVTCPAHGLRWCVETGELVPTAGRSPS